MTSRLLWGLGSQISIFCKIRATDYSYFIISFLEKGGNCLLTYIWRDILQFQLLRLLIPLSITALQSERRCALISSSSLSTSWARPLPASLRHNVHKKEKTRFQIDCRLPIPHYHPSPMALLWVLYPEEIPTFLECSSNGKEYYNGSKVKAE